MVAIDSEVAIILARGGSKGIHRKNLVNFLGKPLVVWTILQTLEANVRTVYVSTDDDEVATVATQAGAIAIARPQELATDTASSDEALVHAIDEVELGDSVCVVMPQVTSPLRLASHIRAAIEVLEAGKVDSVFTANRIDDICVWELTPNLAPVTYDATARKRRQENRGLVVENGSLYCSWARCIRESRNRLSGRIGFSLMPRWTLPELDDMEDLHLCETLMTEYVLKRD